MKLIFTLHAATALLGILDIDYVAANGSPVVNLVVDSTKHGGFGNLRTVEKAAQDETLP